MFNQGLPFSTQQADYTYYRQDPNMSQEVLLRIDDFPHRLAGQRDALERYLRVAIQNAHQRNGLRMFIYNQMSANNWQNQDWIAIVRNLGSLLDFMIFDQQKQGTQQLVGEAVEFTIKLMMLRAVEQYPALQQIMDQAMIADMQTVYNQREVLRNSMNQVAMQNQQGGLMFGNQSNGNNNRQLFNLSTGNDWSSAFSAGTQPQRQSELGGGTSSRISIGDLAPTPPTHQSIKTPSGVCETWESDPNNAHAFVGGGHTDFRGFFAQTEETVVQPNWDDNPQQPVQEQTYRDRILEKFGVVLPLVEIEGREYPVVYDSFYYQLDEKGNLMKQEDHIIAEASFDTKPAMPVIPHYKPIDKTAPESHLNTQVSFLKSGDVENGLIVLDDTIVGLPLDTAANFVNLRTNAYATGRVVEFGLLSVDAVFVPDAEEFYKKFSGLLIEDPETDLSKLMELVKDSGDINDVLYRKLNRRVTTAINRILKENLGLSISISDGASDWMDLPKYLRTKKGEAYMNALGDCGMSLLNAASCVANGAMDETLRGYNSLKLHLNQSSGIALDRKEYNFRPMDEEEIKAADIRVKSECEAGCIGDESFVQLVYRDYVALLPTEFDNLRIELADNEVTVVHSSAHEELAGYLSSLYRRAGGDSCRFDNIYVTTIDGAVMRVVRLALADDTVLGLIRDF